MPEKTKKKTTTKKTAAKKTVKKTAKKTAKNLTKKKAVEGFQKIIGKRLLATSSKGWNAAQAVLAATNISGQEPPETGFCRYLVDGVSHCVGDITETECVVNLGGTFSLVPCERDGQGNR